MHEKKLELAIFLFKSWQFAQVNPKSQSIGELSNLLKWILCYSIRYEIEGCGDDFNSGKSKLRLDFLRLQTLFLCVY